MQFLAIAESTRLTDLSDRIGSNNIESVLHTNGLDRTPNIGKKFYETCKDVMQSASPVNYQRKSTVLNQLASDSDVFESAALLGASGWKLLSVNNTFPGMLRLPETFRLPSAVDVLGNGIHVSNLVYKRAMDSLTTPPHDIDPSIFNEYSSVKPSRILNAQSHSLDVFQGFRIPWGDVSLYSSLVDDYVDFPVYPEELSDGVRANYTQMPDLLYQYEPWQIYSSSGPRTGSYTFDFHRDMWNGDHRDGMANNLIRFCAANCYPQYNGSAVNSSIVTLYFKGKALISGVMTDVTVDWDGPLGLDGWYLHCKLVINITEVSPQALSFNVERTKPLIG